MSVRASRAAGAREQHTGRFAGGRVLELSAEARLQSRPELSLLSSAGEPDGAGEAATATADQSAADHPTAASATSGDDAGQPKSGMYSFFFLLDRSSFAETTAVFSSSDAASLAARFLAHYPMA